MTKKNFDDSILNLLINEQYKTHFCLPEFALRLNTQRFSAYPTNEQHILMLSGCSSGLRYRLIKSFSRVYRATAIKKDSAPARIHLWWTINSCSISRIGRPQRWSYIQGLGSHVSLVPSESKVGVILFLFYVTNSKLILDVSALNFVTLDVGVTHFSKMFMIEWLICENFRRTTDHIWLD